MEFEDPVLMRMTQVCDLLVGARGFGKGQLASTLVQATYAMRIWGPELKRWALTSV